MRIALFLALVTGVFTAGTAAAADWKPIDPTHLALAAPRVDSAADAEALFWEVRVSDDLNGFGDLTTTFDHYLRIKIFTDKGRESFATIDIPYGSGMDVRQVAARTIRPDGSIVELKGSDVHRRTVVKTSDLKVKVVSFAVPAIDRGVIVEYRWREEYRDSIAANLRLQFSRDIPVHVVRYHVRPLSIPEFPMVAWPFNGQFLPPEKQGTGFHVITLHDVAANKDEVYGPPAFEHRPWVFIGYEPRGRSKSADYHKQVAKELHEEYSKRSKPNDAIRTLAARTVVDASTDADRLRALVNVSRERVRRVDVDTASPEDLRKVRATKNASDALDRGIGTADDVVLLALALANAAGLDARVAAVPNRGDLFQRSLKNHPYFLRGRIVAVRSGTQWLFADPTNEHALDGRLPWEYEDQQVLIGDPREAIFAQTPGPRLTDSVKKRTGTFRLLEDGTLEGEARVEYTGHWADVIRETEDQDAAAEREKDLRELLVKRLPGAEITDIKIEHVTDLAGPYTNVFRLRVPGYAQRTGSRLVFPAAVFQKGIEPVFDGAERTSDVYFPFPWTEQDSVTIELPAGFAVEQAPVAKPMDVGAASYTPVLQTTSGNRLVLTRTVVIGKNGLYFDKSLYKALRGFFDAMHRADALTIVLRRVETGK